MIAHEYVLISSFFARQTVVSHLKDSMVSFRVHTGDNPKICHLKKKVVKASQASFWYDNDKDPKTCFTMLQLACIERYLMLLHRENAGFEKSSEFP